MNIWGIRECKAWNWECDVLHACPVERLPRAFPYVYRISSKDHIKIHHLCPRPQLGGTRSRRPWQEHRQYETIRLRDKYELRQLQYDKNPFTSPRRITNNYIFSQISHQAIQHDLGTICLHMFYTSVVIYRRPKIVRPLLHPE